MIQVSPELLNSLWTSTNSLAPGLFGNQDQQSTQNQNPTQNTDAVSGTAPAPDKSVPGEGTGIGPVIGQAWDWLKNNMPPDTEDQAPATPAENKQQPAFVPPTPTETVTPPTGAAEQPGAYQTNPGGPIQNANTQGLNAGPGVTQPTLPQGVTPQTAGLWLNQQQQANAPTDTTATPVIGGLTDNTPTATPPPVTDLTNWGKSQNNINLESGRAAPLPPRPTTPFSRDINPATNRPFTTSEWNSFKSGINPDTGQQFRPGEQEAYANNNGIDMNSFANNHHTLQSLGSILLGGVSQFGTAMQYPYGAPAGIMEHSPLQQYIGEQAAARQYDAGRPAAQAAANTQLEATQAATTEKAAQAAHTQAQTDMLKTFGAGTTNPITGEALQGQDLLSNLQRTNPGVYRNLMDLHNGDNDINAITRDPNGPSRNNYLNLLGMAFPGEPYNEGLYKNKQALIKDFTGSGATTSGGQLASANTAIHHLDEISQAYDTLNNANPQIQNKAVNFIKTQLGLPTATNVDTARVALATELARTFQGGVPTESENKDWQNSFGTGNSPEQFHQGVNTILKMMQERVDATNTRWKSVYGTDFNGVPNTPGANTFQAGLTPDSKAVISRLSGGAAQPGQASNGQPSAQIMHGVQKSTGKPVVSNDGGKSWQLAQ